MSQVRLGIIGCGNISNMHIGYFDRLPELKFVAATDVDPQAMAKMAEKHGVATYPDAQAMMDSGTIDAVLIGTPHYNHPVAACQALERGLHVLVEKPVAVTAQDAQEMNAFYEKLDKKPVFAAMFNARTVAVNKEVKRLIDSGALGPIRRVNWIITTWYRTQAYYNMGSWRATWGGEGGGVLINQCPHQLDLMQWFFGMPEKVTAVIGLGKYHEIEVEDDVTAILEYANGATGVFVTSTGDAPGTNRLEVLGDNGKIVVDKQDSLTFYRNRMSIPEHLRTCPSGFANLEHDEVVYKVAGPAGQHENITRNFIAAILHGEKLVAPAIEGIHGLELGNAMLMSGLQGKPVSVPTDRPAFAAMIKDMAERSTFQKQKAVAAQVDMSKSFG